jgi:hypothetical protein
MTLQEIDQVKDGNEIRFDNSEWCERNESDTNLGGELIWNSSSERFNLFFNGKCMLATASKSHVRQALVKLLDKWNCEIAS